MASGIKIFNQSGKEIFNTDTITWNLIDSFVAPAGQAVSKSYFALNYMKEILIQRQIYNSIPFDQYTLIHSVSNGELGSLSNRQTFTAPAAYVPFGGTTASVTANSAPGTYYAPTTLAASTTPNYGDRDDGAWEIAIPWNVKYCENFYPTIFVTTNGLISFGDFDIYFNGSQNYPYPSILAVGLDGFTRKIFYGAAGSSPNRTYRIITESFVISNPSNPDLGDASVVVEWIFYENDPSLIKMIIWKNPSTTAKNGVYYPTYKPDNSTRIGTFYQGISYSKSYNIRTTKYPEIPTISFTPTTGVANSTVYTLSWNSNNPSNFSTVVKLTDRNGVTTTSTNTTGTISSTLNTVGYWSATIEVTDPVDTSLKSTNGTYIFVDYTPEDQVTAVAVYAAPVSINGSGSVSTLVNVMAR